MKFWVLAAKKCQQLEANVKEAVANLNLTMEVSPITDPIEITKRGVMSTPAIAIFAAQSIELM